MTQPRHPDRFITGFPFGSFFSEKPFLTAALLYLLIYSAFYPIFYSFIDEASYFAIAQVLKSGNLFIHSTVIPVPSWIETLGRKVFDYPLGMPLILLPFTYLGWKSLFLPVLFCHLAGAYFFSKLLRIHGAHSAIAIFLYVFYPPFILFSRTWMGDIPANTLFLAGLYCLKKKDPVYFFAGLLWAGAFFIRPSNGVFMVPYLAFESFCLIQRRSVDKFFYFLLPLAGMILLTACYHNYILGSFFLTPYSQKFAELKNFSWNYLSINLPHYLTSLLAVYPGMLLVLFFRLKTRTLSHLAAIGLGIIFFGAYFFHDDFSNSWLTAVFGSRFLFPAISLMLLMYSEAIETLLKKFRPSIRLWLQGITFCVLMSSAILIHHQHQEHLQEQLLWRDTIYQTTPKRSVLIYDGSVAKYLQAEWGNREYAFFRDGKPLLTDYLKKTDFARGVYVIKKTTFPGPLSLGWVSPEESAELLTHYDTVLKARQGILEIYQLYEKQRS